MKKYALLALSVTTVAGLVGLSSCSKDDPIPRPKVSFENSTDAFGEKDGAVSVNVILDLPAQEDITVEYDVNGTALEGSPSTTNTDYQITSDAGKVKIRKGQVLGAIELKLKSDGVYEGDETIEFEITSVSSAGVDISENNKIAITITEGDPQPIASFKVNKLSTSEDENIDVEIVLDQAAGQDVILTYEILNEDQWLDAPIAISDVYADANDIPRTYWDFGTYTDTEDNFGEITIPKGEKSVLLHVGFYLDFRLDHGETITIKLTGAKANAATAATTTAKNTTVITVAQQDGLDIELGWGTTAADLNLYLFGATSVANVSNPDQRYILGGSAFKQESTDDPGDAFEQVFLPFSFVGLRDQNNQTININYFGISVNYRAGSVDPLAFTTYYGEFVDGDFDESTFVEYDATYTAENVNDPVAGGDEPPAVQLFGRNGDKYSAPTDIVVPGSGSRMRSGGMGFKGFGKTIMTVNGRQIWLAGSPADLMKNPYHIKPGVSLTSRYH